MNTLNDFGENKENQRQNTPKGPNLAASNQKLQMAQDQRGAPLDRVRMCPETFVDVPGINIDILVIFHPKELML